MVEVNEISHQERKQQECQKQINTRLQLQQQAAARGEAYDWNYEAWINQQLAEGKTFPVAQLHNYMVEEVNILFEDRYLF